MLWIVPRITPKAYPKGVPIHVPRKTDRRLKSFWHGCLRGQNIGQFSDKNIGQFDCQDDHAVLAKLRLRRGVQYSSPLLFYQDWLTRPRDGIHTV
ncbi:MAG: hypothetical protein WEB58_09760 [Planctomycetaceae bacterium]